MQIRHLIFLIHPGCYEAILHSSPERIIADDLGLFLQREREVASRWRTAITAARPDALLLQLYGASNILDHARHAMGPERVCSIKADFPGPDRLMEYYSRLCGCIRAHLEKFDLTIDPAAVTSELWGESFEGCVAGYGSAFAHQLGLRISPKMCFDMTVFDSRFLHESNRHEPIPIPGTDIEAFMFELKDRSMAAMFQARLHPQWLDNRVVQLDLDFSRVKVCTKTGQSLWPNEKSQPALGGGSTSRYSLSPKDSLWLHSDTMHYDDFRAVIQSARLLSATPEASMQGAAQ